MTRHPWECPERESAALDFPCADDHDQDTMLGAFMAHLVERADKALRAGGVAEGLAGLPDEVVNRIRAGARVQAVAGLGLGRPETEPKRRAGRPRTQELAEVDVLVFQAVQALQELRPDLSRNACCRAVWGELGRGYTPSTVRHTWRRGAEETLRVLRAWAGNAERETRPPNPWRNPALQWECYAYMKRRGWALAEEIAAKMAAAEKPPKFDLYPASWLTDDEPHNV